MSISMQILHLHPAPKLISRIHQPVSQVVLPSLLYRGKLLSFLQGSSFIHISYFTGTVKISPFNNSPASDNVRLSALIVSMTRIDILWQHRHIFSAYRSTIYIIFYKTGIPQFLLRASAILKFRCSRNCIYFASNKHNSFRINNPLRSKCRLPSVCPSFFSDPSIYIKYFL